MKDVFAETDDFMHRPADSSNVSPIPSHAPSDMSPEGHICPFCGLTREVTEDFDPASPCPRCTLADTQTTRNATKARIGPWHVRQVRNPWAPGMRFETLIALVKRGQVTKDSIVRGPTTHQLWKRAAEVKGLSREFGLCHSCGGAVEKTASLCPNCNRLQEPPVNPDVLVEGRELLAARETPPAPARESRETREAPPPRENASPAPNPSREPSRPNRNPPTPMSAPVPALFENPEDPTEPAHIEIGSVAPPPSDEMLSAVSEDEVALGRQITTRPPARPPGRPRPLRPAAPGADDALLTPQELAQAFQLNFTPEPKPRGGPSKKTVAVVLLLLVGAGAAALMFLRPDYREAISSWTSEKWSAMTSFVSSRTTPAAPATSGSSSVALEDVDDPVTQPSPGPVVIAPPPAPEPREVEVADAAVQDTAPLTTAPAAIGPSETDDDPSTIASVKIPQPSPPDEIPPAPVEETTAPEPSPAPAPAVASLKMPEGTPEEQARTLWGRAIDAEGNQDYREAVQCYELIQTLPADVQPWGLELRLEQARKQTQ